MIIYVNRNNKQFKKVTITDFRKRDPALEFLKAHGFGFFANDDVNLRSPLDSLLQAIHSLPVISQVKLGNLINQAIDPSNSAQYINPKDVTDDNHDKIINDLDQLYIGSNADLLDTYEINIIINFLNGRLSHKHWQSWMIVGGARMNRLAYVWLYNDQKLPINPYKAMHDDEKHNFYGSTWLEYLTTVMFGKVYQIDDCDNSGRTIGHDTRYVRTMRYMRDTDPNDDYLNSYMAATYGMLPATQKRISYE